jgi:hypothetical protein
MVRALEDLGLVERNLHVPVAPTGLTGPVKITDEGLARVRALAEEMIDTGCIELAVQSVVCQDWTSKESQERDPALLTEGLRRVRKSLGDHGELDCNKEISSERFPVWKEWDLVTPYERGRRRERYLEARRQRRRWRKVVARERARYAQHTGMRPLQELYPELVDEARLDPEERGH